MSSDPNEAGKKRLRASKEYPRRRSVTACQICRGRKSKCDNQRPSCGFCLMIGAVCVYEEQSDFMNYDAASLHIIDKLESLERQVERLQCNPGTSNNEGFVGYSKPPVLAVAQFPSVESILEWPVFQWLELGLQGRSLPLVHSKQNEEKLTEYHIPHGEELLDSSQMDDFISAFMWHVHIKNPILDPQDLITALEVCKEEGIKEDLPSALVAICCALGMHASPLRSRSYETHQAPLPLQPIVASLSRKCFNKARTILSMQGPSLLVVQCLFFCGVYEMYNIRPVTAWIYFSQASLHLRLHLPSDRGFPPNQSQTAEDRLIQRLYWSCMQSECELANELKVKSSGLEDVQFPFAFPNPPSTMDSTTEPVFPLDEIEAKRDMQSWMYYLSETSLRRIGNEILSTLYTKTLSSFSMSNILSLQNQSENLDDKLSNWMMNLPQDLRINELAPKSTNELGVHIRCRYLMCRIWIYRPFLYIMVHATPDGLATFRQRVEPLALRCLESCMQLVDSTPLLHQHHGSWYMCRITFSCSLMLLAAAKVGCMALPPRWEECVASVIRDLKYWELQSKDISASLEILEKLWTLETDVF